MKKTILFLLIMLQSWAFGQELPTVAIVAFEGRGMSEIDADNVTDRFSYELSRANKFTITEREMMSNILEEQEFQLSGCTDVSCAVKLGKILSARKILVGSVIKRGRGLVISGRIVDVEKGIAEFSGTGTAKTGDDL